ncbi:hypothetical protein SAMN05444407_105270 [Chryseobacterium contaminans]|uniref:Uncharacterized protein n=1 Tax=Chryseobacterium contaminans TaxID=1423959 RepID=A0A1M7CL39_9FLAO|nr:hypothetical protein SAMN05444407_105270 [Chryseobacterium contaminans]
MRIKKIRILRVSFILNTTLKESFDILTFPRNFNIFNDLETV